jgi:hypothetical protein
MKLLKENGYQKFRIPQGKFADHLLQKKIYIDFLDENLYINAYVYDPDEVRPVRSVEFSFQREGDEGCVKIKLFGYEESDLSSRKLEDIEEKAINLYTYSEYA